MMARCERCKPDRSLTWPSLQATTMRPPLPWCSADPIEFPSPGKTDLVRNPKFKRKENHHDEVDVQPAAKPSHKCGRAPARIDDGGARSIVPRVKRHEEGAGLRTTVLGPSFLRALGASRARAVRHP